MSRTRPLALTTLALVGAAALALLPALPATAATKGWTQPGNDWWTSATWSGGLPVAGDDVEFDGGPISTYNIAGTVDYRSFTFIQDHEIWNGPGVGVIGLTHGLVVEAGVTASIDRDMRTSGSQSWTVADGAELTVPSWIEADPAGTLTLDVDGTLRLTGNIGADGTGSIVKTGTGTVLRTGGVGGGIGGGGLDVREGVFELEGAAIGGTAFQVNGGTLSGAGTINALTLSSGVLAPGLGAGAGTGLLTTGNATLSGGTFLVTVDATGAGSNDALHAPGATLLLSGTTLDIATIGTPSPGDLFEIAGTDLGGTIVGTSRFLSPAGDVLEHGDEFVTGGHVYRIDYAFGAGGLIDVVYVGAAPVPEALPSTGTELWLGAGIAVMLLAAGAGLAALRPRARG